MQERPAEVEAGRAELGILFPHFRERFLELDDGFDSVSLARHEFLIEDRIDATQHQQRKRSDLPFFVVMNRPGFPGGS